jgi:hypothetical protein
MIEGRQESPENRVPSFSGKAELVRAAKICSNPLKQTDQPMAIAHTTNIAPITARAIAAEGALRGLLLLLIRP